MADLGNSCQFIGNLGNDPELTYLQDGTARARFRLAVNDRKRNPQDGSLVENTFWVSVTALGKQADLVAERLHKGSRILTRGKLEPREWTGNDGQKRFSLDLLQRDMEFLDGRREPGTDPATPDTQPAGAPVDEGELPF
jgi:single-strand DNA-binding protein